MTPLNITPGFMATGISPFNLDTFTDGFVAAFVTDRPKGCARNQLDLEQAALAGLEQYGFQLPD